MMPYAQLGPPPDQYSGGYSQQPPASSYGYPPPQQQGIPRYDPADAHPSTQGHDGIMSPGDLHFTHKKYWTRIGIAILAGFLGGCIFMFRLFPIVTNVLQAIQGG